MQTQKKQKRGKNTRYKFNATYPEKNLNREDGLELGEIKRRNSKNYRKNQNRKDK